jgi:hypothetical protein
MTSFAVVISGGWTDSRSTRELGSRFVAEATSRPGTHPPGQDQSMQCLRVKRTVDCPDWGLRGSERHSVANLVHLEREDVVRT